MDVNAEVITALIVLLPGFVCAKIVQWLCVRPNQSEMDKVIEALLYSFVIYASFWGIFGRVDHLDRWHLIALGAFSIALGAILSLGWNRDAFGSMLRRLGFTNRTSRPSVWHDVFHYYGGYVLVEMADGKLLLGWVKYYSDNEEAPSLFLEDASWVTRKGERFPLEGPGVLLTSKSGIKSVSFHKPTDTRQFTVTAR